MFLGRMTGWLLLLIAVLAASAEAVVAVGTGEYVGIATSDVITIITGVTPEIADSVAGKIMLWPAWVMIGSFGLLLTTLCRKKKYRTGFISK